MAAKCGKCDPHEICEECPEWIFTLADLIMCMMGLFVLLWSFGAGPPFLEPGGLFSLAAVVLVVGVIAAGALHRYRRPDRTVLLGLAVLAAEAIGLTTVLGPSPLAVLGWMLEVSPGPVMLGAVVRRARPVVGVAAAAVSVPASA